VSEAQHPGAAGLSPGTGATRPAAAPRPPAATLLCGLRTHAQGFVLRISGLEAKCCLVSRSNYQKEIELKKKKKE